MQTAYANLVMLKMTQNELVLEFACHIPAPGTPPGIPIGVPPDIRVVLVPSALDGLINSLQQAKANRDATLATQRAQLGFKAKGSDL
jgi:hypothetical protein